MSPQKWGLGTSPQRGPGAEPLAFLTLGSISKPGKKVAGIPMPLGPQPRWQAATAIAFDVPPHYGNGSRRAGGIHR